MEIERHREGERERDSEPQPPFGPSVRLAIYESQQLTFPIGFLPLNLTAWRSTTGMRYLYLSICLYIYIHMHQTHSVGPFCIRTYICHCDTKNFWSECPWRWFRTGATGRSPLGATMATGGPKGIDNKKSFCWTSWNMMWRLWHQLTALVLWRKHRG